MIWTTESKHVPMNIFVAMNVRLGWFLHGNQFSKLAVSFLKFSLVVKENYLLCVKHSTCSISPCRWEMLTGVKLVLTGVKLARCHRIVSGRAGIWTMQMPEPVHIHGVYCHPQNTILVLIQGEPGCGNESPWTEQNTRSGWWTKVHTEVPLFLKWGGQFLPYPLYGIIVEIT